MIRRWRGLVAVSIAVLALLIPLFTPEASAHASLVKASPANNEQLRRPPARVLLNFSEAIERKLTSIQVTDQNKNRVDTNDLAFDDSDPTFASIGVKSLAPGLYFVRWNNVSAVDGHNLSGEYPFVVLNADGSFPAGVSLTGVSAQTSGGSLLPSNVDVTFKWMALLALAMAGGATFFLLAVLRPAASFLEQEDYERAVGVAEGWIAGMLHVLLPLAFIASASLILLTVHRFGTSVGIWSYLTTVRVGEYRLAQLLLILLALAGANALILAKSKRKRTAGLGVVLLASAGALLTYSMTSHSASGTGEVWAVGSDYVHLLASATWLGALVMIFLFLRWRRAGLDETPRLLLLANAFDRFSIVATLSVIAILATGTFNGLTAIPTASAMIHTTYGKVLIAKLVLLMPLLGVAGLNAYVLKPRLVSAIDRLYQEGGQGADRERAGGREQLRWLQRIMVPAVAIELALVLAIFAAVAVLSQAATAKGETAARAAQSSAGVGKFEQDVEQADLKLGLTVTPNAVGINTYDLIIQNKADSSPSTTVTQARLRFNYQDIPNAVAPSEVILNKFAPGEYKGAGAYFTEPGNWLVEVTIRRSDKDDVTRSFVLPVARGLASTATKKNHPFAMPFTVFSWSQVLGAVVALAGAVVLIFRRELAGVVGRSRRVVVTAATAILLAGFVLAFAVRTGTKAANLSAGNPVTPNQASVARGKTLFQQNCVQCHGIDGRGDGPQSPQLNPAPTDFRLHMPLHTDPQFYNFIANGYPGSAMPPFRQAFSDTDIWNLVNYLRSAFTQAPTQ